MFVQANTQTMTGNAIAASTAWWAWQNDMEGWRKLKDEATNEETKKTYERMLRRSESYFEQHMGQLKGAGEGQKIEMDYEF